MKLRSLLFGLCAASSLTASAQTWITDSVNMSPNYVNDVFYSLPNSVQKIQPANDWTIALQTTIFGDASFNAAIRVNHAQGVALYSLHLAASTKFTSLAAADTIGKTTPATQLLNNDTSWGTGAFIQNRNPADVFDYGWGEYAGAPTHALNGDSLYLLKIAGGGTYKITIQNYASTPADSISYTFRIANFDGTNDKTIKFYRKNGFTDRLFAYYKAGDAGVTDREPSRSAWDLLFTTYSKMIPTGPTTQGLYTLTGVLANQGVQIADVRNVKPDTAHYQNYTRTTKVNEIGDDWKTYVNPGPNGYYQLDSTATFFIKSVNSNYYQLQFTRFDGGTTGKVVFRKRAVATTAVTNVAAENIATWTLVPNPANDKVNVMVDAKDNAADAKMIVVDASGRVVEQMAAPIQKGMNAFGFSSSSLPSGIYFIRLGNATWSVTQRLVVAH